MCFIEEVSEATDLSLYMGLKNLILSAFHLVADIGAVSIASMLFCPSGPRSPGDSDTLRRRPCKAVHYCCKKPVFCQLKSSFPVILKLSEVPLEVGFVLIFKVEFEPEAAELEPVIERFPVARLPIIGGFLTGLPGGEECDISPVEENSLSLFSD